MSLILLVNAQSSGRRARHRVWPFLALLPFLLLAACTSPEQREAQHFERALALYDEGDDQRAMVELRNVLQINPKNADAIYQIGLIHERAGRTRQALAAFEQAISEKPDLLDAQIKLGILALGAGSLERAERAAEAIEQAEPGHLGALILKGSVAIRKGELQEAVDLANAALAKEPDNEHAVAVLVGVDNKLGEYERSLARLDDALAVDPENIGLLLLKIRTLEQTGQSEDLAAAYKQVIALDPEDVTYRTELARFHYQRQEFADAEAVLKQAIEDGVLASEVTDALLHLVYEQRGVAAAETEIQNLIKREPSRYELQFTLAKLYAAEGKPEKAEAVLATIAAQSKEAEIASDARAGMARIQLARGDVSGGRALVEEILSASPDHAEANLLRGMILLDEGEHDEAIRTARLALRSDPEWLPGLQFLAEVHLARGEADLAVDALAQALSVAPTDVRSAEMLGALLANRGDYESALKVWDQVVRIAEDPSRALRARAEIEMRRGHFSAAEADIKHLLELPGQEFSGALLAGELSLAQRRFEQSREWYAKALELNPDASIPVVGNAYAYLLEGDVDAAVTHLDAQMQDEPENAMLFYLKGVLLTEQRERVEAEAAFRDAMRLRPEWFAPYQLLVRMLLQDGRTATAVEVYRAALDHRPDDPVILAELAELYYIMGNSRDAIATYEHLLTLRPDHQIAQNNYAALVADFAHDQPERLDRALELALRFQTSENPDLLDTLGWLHFRKGDFTVAANLVERAVVLAPDNPQFRYHLGAALERTGQIERAVEEFLKAVVDGADYPGLDEARAMLADLQEQLSGTQSHDRAGRAS